VWERAYAGSGIALYDLTGEGRSAEPAVHPPSPRESTCRAGRPPRCCDRDALIGAIEYYDAQVDDARFTMMLARTAATHGALVANRARVIAVERSGERVTGARVTDTESGRTFVVRAKVVISATGVWSGEIQTLADVEDPLRVRASKGVHLIVPAVDSNCQRD
jgi:glycerol-3-phosphate dehydrogenase